MKINPRNHSFALKTLIFIFKSPKKHEFKLFPFILFYLREAAADNTEKEVKKTEIRKNVRELHSGDYFGLYSFIAG